MTPSSSSSSQKPDRNMSECSFLVTVLFPLVDLIVALEKEAGFHQARQSADCASSLAKKETRSAWCGRSSNAVFAIDSEMSGRERAVYIEWPSLQATIYWCTRKNTVNCIFRMWRADVSQPEKFIGTSGISNTIKLCTKATFRFEGPKS
jgi:hypothetical protein